MRRVSVTSVSALRVFCALGMSWRLKDSPSALLMTSSASLAATLSLRSVSMALSASTLCSRACVGSRCALSMSQKDRIQQPVTLCAHPKPSPRNLQS